MWRAPEARQKQATQQKMKTDYLIHPLSGVGRMSAFWMVTCLLAVSAIAQPAPTLFRAAPGDREVRLEWEATTGVAGYRVKQATTPTGPASVIASNLTQASLVVTSPDPFVSVLLVLVVCVDAVSTRRQRPPARADLKSARLVSGERISFGIQVDLIIVCHWMLVSRRFPMHSRSGVLIIC